jgi:hypothetical protein
MNAQTPRGPLAPVHSVNENKVLRQGPQPFSFGTGSARPRSPTKVSPDLHPTIPRSLIVVPKPSGCGLAQSPHTEAAASAENAELQAESDRKPRHRLPQLINGQAKRHGFEPTAGLPLNQ